ncbi:MAG: TIGR03986 family CRISPR-associated RAMP protein [Eubacteriales bacterium]|nr:TIGR03986 family CRISPR-associated RAMP protein [Eubacteriales bacterium]
MSKYQFVNPYNFIPLSKDGRGKREASAGEKEYMAEEMANYTGVIHYSVLTKTPLFIPNTSSGRAFAVGTEDHKSYDFFSYTDLSKCQTAPEEPTALPVIPGSEMRGMLRSNFEILTNSCMSAIDDDVTLSKRSQERYLPGLLRRKETGGYDLYPAEDHLMRTMGANSLEDDWEDDPKHWSRRCYIQEDMKEGDKVYFKRELRSRGKNLAKCVKLEKKSYHNAEGYVIKGEDGIESTQKQQKHCCHVFTPVMEKQIQEQKKQKKNKQVEEIRRGVSLDTLEKALNEYTKNKKHLYIEYTKKFQDFQKGNGEEYFPVYYSEAVHGHLMLSPACITREIYETKLKNLIGEEHRTCTDPKRLCPACSLFGTVVDKGASESGENFAHTSRIRVSDLNCVCDRNEVKDYYSSSPITLLPLSGPKLNNMEFYLQRPEGAVFWTYDYYIDANGTIHPYNGSISGRKFYWHQPELTCGRLEKDMETLEKNPEVKIPGTRVSGQRDQMNVTIRPVRENVSFTGELYFQNLTRTELNQLIYLLSAGDEEDISRKKHGYKLGGAKPLGFGSIAVSVDKVELLVYERNEENRRVERKVVPYKEYQAPEFDGEIEKDFLEMTAFDAVEGENVRYPYVHGKENIYDWFTQNHVRYAKGRSGQKEVSHGMPMGRREMAYAEYMEAMKPGLMVIDYGGAGQGMRQERQRAGEAAAVRRSVQSRKETGAATVETAVVNRIAKSGNVMIKVNGEEGTIYGDSLGERTLSAGETVRVRFTREKTYPNGTKMKFYRLV